VGSGFEIEFLISLYWALKRVSWGQFGEDRLTVKVVVPLDVADEISYLGVGSHLLFLGGVNLFC
jgi:ABC-type transport system involved in cytochrome c biogenesis permease subunit